MPVGPSGANSGLMQCSKDVLAIPSLLPSLEFLASRIPSGGLRGTTLRAARRRDCATHHGHALGISDKLSRLLVRLHQSEDRLQPRDHIPGLQNVLLLSDVAREDSSDGICQFESLYKGRAKLCRTSAHAG